MAIRWITALVLPPMAASVRIAFSKASRVRIWDSFWSSCTISTMRRPAVARQHVAPAVHGGVGGVAGQADAQRLDHAGHGAGGAHGHAVAVAAVHAALGLEEVLQLERAGAHLLAHAPDAGARAEFLSAPLAVEHGAAADADGGQVDAGRAHQQRWAWSCRSPSAAPRRRSGCRGCFLRRPCWRGCGRAWRWGAAGLAQRHHRELEREAAGLVDADLDLLGQRAEVAVAGRELAEGVADADDRAAVELVVRHPCP
jgi:hypothetical protein